MGCISSKLLAATDLDREVRFYGSKAAAGDCPNHVVLLASSTYGVLNLDRSEDKGKEDEDEEEEFATKKWNRCSPASMIRPSKRRVLKEEPSEIINAWELMGDLDEEMYIWSPLKKSHAPMRPSSPAKVTATPKKQRKKSVGKENSPLGQGSERSDLDSNRVLRPFSSFENAQWVGSVSTIPKKNTPTSATMQKSGRDYGGSGSRRSLSPLFDPELLASLEKAHHEEGEQIKKMIDPARRHRRGHDLGLLLQSFQEKCPPGGENVVILYTTTLRGIRKTYEDCNAVRCAIESHDVRTVERDISMDSGYREELRLLMGEKEVRVPVVFVKGRLIGGAEEVLELEEEGKLGLLLEGIPRAESWCKGCGGMRFVMCMDCNGSCKVLDREQKKMVRCGRCNENGLIHCPLCC
ncbi:uncharacterized protein LOC120112118 [Phoenix dactylifera]|uniref:Uncharacterized protein LOC103703228 n=1 Tax=Phoenix dactylifera TaxID=42345 RepID=A0A8B9ARS8_PHODC|nr:uncharacterized protein LOC103703228 [Phoenix dactylifera]XP_038986688.1 uncharacterized protein LOC120112118 [Phoenix dactylifera]